MEFNPANPVVKLCLQGMQMEDSGKPAEAFRLFEQAWNEAEDDFEKFLAAYYLARVQTNILDKLNWLKTALQFAQKVNDVLITSVFPNLYKAIAGCYETIGDTNNAKLYETLSMSAVGEVSDKGPFYHGTRVDLPVGGLLTAGNPSNYQPAIIMNHIYFTAQLNGAGLAAALARGEGKERVYIVEPTGNFENDPNVTDKKFPGNPTRSYRTRDPLKIIGEIGDWLKLTPEELKGWREKLANMKGEIIN